MVAQKTLFELFRPEQETAKIALALNTTVPNIKIKSRLVVGNISLVTFSTNPHFLKWLLWGRNYYQAKFSGSTQLIAIVKLKIRSLNYT